MAISYIGSTGGAAINGGNVTLTLPGTYTGNDVAYVAVTLGTSKTATLSVASSSGLAYTQVVSTIASSYVRFGVFRYVLPSTATTQAVVTGTGTSTDSTCAVVHIFRGESTGTPEDVSATSTTGLSSTPNSISITVVNKECAIITSMGFGNSANACSGPTGLLNAVVAPSTDTNPSQTGQAWILNNSTSPYDPAAWTNATVSTAWCAATIAVRANIPAGYAAWVTQHDPSPHIDEQRRVVIESY